VHPTLPGLLGSDPSVAGIDQQHQSVEQRVLTKKLFDPAVQLCKLERLPRVRMLGAVSRHQVEVLITELAMAY
jgi:hypothetical protein